jgi:hypothetical protein
MPLLSKPSSAAHLSLLYITVGALLGVWSGIRYVYLRNHDVGNFTTEYYWCAGLVLSGLVLLIIGLALGRIGRAARHAELPPEEVTGAEANAVQNAAARAPIVATTNPAVQPPPVVPAVPPVTQVPTGVPVAASQPLPNRRY